MNERSKIALLVAGALLCIGAAGVMVRSFQGDWHDQYAPTTVAGPALSLNAQQRGVSPEPVTKIEEGKQYAYIDGAVQRKGLYEIPPNGRVQQLIEAAGGTLPDADISDINPAAPVKDGERITVKFLSRETLQSNASERRSKKTYSDASSGTDYVFINTADEEELQRLPGVGAVIAERIAEYRKTHGPFSSVEDLLKVRGIGEKNLQKMRKQLRF
ncbi:MAG: ComEA family DNA-binding protein [Pyramidobacter sp.]|nr:ComEA family DNA-binding protein [Pyramidobacter sp.]